MEAPGGLGAGQSRSAQLPSKFVKNVVRTLANPSFEPRTSQSRTPHQLPDGSITPNGLHFAIVHRGVPDIDPDVRRPESAVDIRSFAYTDDSMCELGPCLIESESRG
jgi:hypothetical protein